MNEVLPLSILLCFISPMFLENSSPPLHKSDFFLSGYEICPLDNIYLNIFKSWYSCTYKSPNEKVSL